MAEIMEPDDPQASVVAPGEPGQAGGAGLGLDPGTEIEVTTVDSYDESPQTYTTTLELLEERLVRDIEEYFKAEVEEDLRDMLFCNIVEEVFTVDLNEDANMIVMAVRKDELYTVKKYMPLRNVEYIERKFIYVEGETWDDLEVFNVGIADVAKQVWERGHPLEKAIGIPVLAAGAFVVGAIGGIASLISPKAWYETAVALSRPRETLAGLKETIAENPFRATAIAGALAAPVKLPKLAGVGVVERVRLVPERLKAAVVSETGALAKVEAVWPSKTWKAFEAEAELARRGLAKAVRAEPEQIVQLERASKVSEYVMGELSKRTYVKLEQVELPTRYEVAVKDPSRLFKDYEAFVEVTGRTEVLGHRLGRLPEGLDFEVRGERWARALRERFDWNVYERRVYAKDVEQVSFKKVKEFETFERLTVKGERFEYKARIVDPEAVLEKIPAKPARLRQLDELLRVREIEVVRPIPGPPGVPALAHLLRPSRGSETVLEEIKSAIPVTPKTIELPKLVEPPVRVDVDAAKYATGEVARPVLRLPTAETLSQQRELEGIVARLSTSMPDTTGMQLPQLRQPGLRAVEMVDVGSGGIPALASLPKLHQELHQATRLPSTPALDIVRMERFSIDTISSLGLSRTPETVLESIEARPATPAELPRMRELPIRVDVDARGSVVPEIPDLALQPVAEGVRLPHPWAPGVVETKPRLGQPDVLKQITAAEARPVQELLKPLLGVRATLGPRAAVAQASEPRPKTAEAIDVDVKTLERIGFHVKQMPPPKLQELTMPELPPTTRTQARAGRTVKQEPHLPSLGTELRKLRLQRWEWELPEWGRGLRKLLGL